MWVIGCCGRLCHGFQGTGLGRPLENVNEQKICVLFGFSALGYALPVKKCTAIEKPPGTKL